MMLIRNLNALLIFSFFFFSSCTQKQELSDSIAESDSLTVNYTALVAPDTIQQKKEMINDTASVCRLDNVARFIAGFQQEDTASFSTFETDSYWQEYKISMDTNWNRMYRERLGKIKKW